MRFHLHDLNLDSFVYPQQSTSHVSGSLASPAVSDTLRIQFLGESGNILEFQARFHSTLLTGMAEVKVLWRKAKQSFKLKPRT